MSDNSIALNGPSAVPSDSKAKIRIVVADDHPIFRDGLCKLLALEEDFEVVAQAQDGRQVLDVLQQLEPDILLLDLRMPGLDGLATLQRLQAAKNRTRVIVLTASDDKNEFVQAMKLGHRASFSSRPPRNCSSRASARCTPARSGWIRTPPPP